MGDKAFMHSFYYAVIVFKAYVYLFNLSCERLYNATIVFNIFFLHAKKCECMVTRPTHPDLVSAPLKFLLYFQKKIISNFTFSL